MNRKPVICTSNNLVWQFQTNERIPFLNRSFQYLNLHKTELIKEYDKPACPKFWQDVLSFIDDQLVTMQTESVDWTKFYDPLDQGIHEYIENIPKETITDADLEIPQTPMADLTELNSALEIAMYNASNQLKAKRKLMFDDETDGHIIKASKRETNQEIWVYLEN